MKKLCSLLLVLLLLFTGCTYISDDVEEFEIHVIDVGQGEAILLRHKDKTALIDSGQYKSYDKLKSYLQGEGVSYIDYIIATHPDADHIGAMSEVINDFEVGTIYMPDKEHTTTSYKELIKAIYKNEVSIIYGIADMNFELTDEIQGQFLSPQDKVYGENNHYSLVLYLAYENFSFLFMGDAEKENEEEIIRNYPNLKADFIKLGHHGSSSSSIEKFITAIKPSVAASSSGLANSYGHPHQDVVDILKKEGILLYRTDEQGDLVFYCDGKTLYSNQENEGSYEKGK